ncbi:MAG: UDP-N-acetylglucosamine 2-epimerase [Bacteroidetes bacterium]|nr:UDP-N-acetylglucosamine 2-epimerase [Bacteroidota bacterium]
MGVRVQAVFCKKLLSQVFNYFINFDPEDYAAVLNNAKCCVGNSSSFIREGGYLGVPAVMIGDRQEGREHGENVVYCGYSGTEITEAVSLQSSHKRFESSKKYGAGKSGTKIAEILVSIDLDFRKMITY